MVPNSITKLIDEAILPAVALIVAKMLGLLLAVYFLKLPFVIENHTIFWILPSVHFNNLADYIIAENYSNLSMFMAAALGTVYVLVRAHFFHESHIRPNVHARLARLSLESLVAPSYHLYHQAAIWILFLWLTVGFLILSTVIGVTYTPISVVAFITAANLSWILALDIEKEVEIAKNNNEE